MNIKDECLIPLGSNWYELKLPLSFQIGTLGYSIIVPKGFRTNLASVPSCFEWLVPHDGKYWYASILHDYLYSEFSTENVNQHDSDFLFEYYMKKTKVPYLTRNFLHHMVFIFGQHFYKDVKLNGDVPVNKTAFIDKTDDYEAYRKNLTDKYGDIF